jgi:hypothetical protein
MCARHGLDDEHLSVLGVRFSRSLIVGDQSHRDSGSMGFLGEVSVGIGGFRGVISHWEGV